MVRRLLIAPDAFKGALSSLDAARSLARGWRASCPDDPLTLHPLADGGEGTIEAIEAAVEGSRHRERVSGPSGAPVEAEWWLSADERLAVVELACASGLHLVRGSPAPLRATSRGTGELLAAAARSPARRILLGAGGSATVDGGLGALIALGFRALDGAGRSLPSGGGALVDLARLEAPAGLEQAGWSRRLTVLCDVRNPLLGPEGAAPVYGPQKGAGPIEVARLERGLSRWSRCLPRDPSRLPGAGAAGGLAGGLWGALGAALRPGLEVIAELTGLDARLATCDLVLSGEGRVDAQTARGKVVAALAARWAGPLLAFGGSITPAAEIWARRLGRLCLVPIADGPQTLERSMAQTAELLERAASRTADLWRVACAI